jgi:hypothetical protein
MKKAQQKVPLKVLQVIRPSTFPKLRLPKDAARQMSHPLDFCLVLWDSQFQFGLRLNWGLFSAAFGWVSLRSSLPLLALPFSGAEF